MINVRRIRLDVLKPHHPNALEFAKVLAEVGAEAGAEAGDEFQVRLTVMEIDKHTETLQVVVEGQAIDFDAIQEAIGKMGASLHSIDEVEVHAEPEIPARETPARETPT